MFLDAVVFVVCPALFVAGAVTDLLSFKIPNWIPAALAASFALAPHMPRAEAQALVKAACRDALKERCDMLEVLAQRTAAPVDWDRLRRQAEQPAAADSLIDRALAEGPENARVWDLRPGRRVRLTAGVLFVEAVAAG